MSNEHAPTPKVVFGTPPNLVAEQLTLKQLTEILIRHYNLTEGFYELSVEINFTAANAGPSQDQVLPSAIVSFSRVGLAVSSAESPLAIDAATINHPA